ncbi:MAG: hypothetical protein E6730_13290 [Enterococcus casseliflavus]|nr:hypothetical protein [Enterococcus casseliflavus]
MAGDNNKIKNRYNRVSKIYDLMEKPMESMLMDDWRKGFCCKVLNLLSNKVE